MKPHVDIASGLTVIMPVFNRASIVGETLDSISAQNRRPEELILVDNASTDGSLEVIEDWAAKMRAEGWRVTVLSEPRKGAARARQTGLERVGTPYVMFFDSDDWMAAGHIDYVYKELVRPGVLDLLCWNVRFVDADGGGSDRRILPRNPVMNHFVQGLLSTQAFAVRTSLLLVAGGWNPAIGGWDDYELGVRLLLRHPRLRVDPAVRVYVRRHGESITGDGFAHRAGDWEHTLDAVERDIKSTSDSRADLMLRLLAYRRANLAAHYHREGRDDIATPLMKRALAEPALRRYDRMLLRIARLYTGLGLPWAGAIFPPLLRVQL